MNQVTKIELASTIPLPMPNGEADRSMPAQVSSTDAMRVNAFFEPGPNASPLQWRFEKFS
jgi:hypothetical protein